MYTGIMRSTALGSVEINRDGSATVVRNNGTAYRTSKEMALIGAAYCAAALRQLATERGTYLGENGPKEVRAVHTRGRSAVFHGGQVKVDNRAENPNVYDLGTIN